MGDLLSRLQMSSSPSPSGVNSAEENSPAMARQGRRMAVDQGRPGVGVDAGEGQGGKTTLVMGYRAECEKCRAGVVGHFNHFVKRL